MATFLRTRGMLLFLAGVSPSLATVAWVDVTCERQQLAHLERLPVCQVPIAHPKPESIHWPPELHGRRRAEAR